MTELQLPQPANTASRFLQMMQLFGGQNAAAADLAKAQEDARKQKVKESVEANEFALNVLSGVQSEEDLQIAKRQFVARYPEQAGQVEQLLPRFDPRGVDLIRNSLRKENEMMKIETEEWNRENKITAYSPGSALYKGGKEIGKVPTAEPKPDFEVFQDGGGNQAYVRKGDKIPAGWSKVVPKGSSSTVNVHTGDLTKPTKTKLEQDIIEGTRNIQSFHETGRLFKDDYLTYVGKGEKEIANVMDKAGISTDSQKKFINERQQWFRKAKADFIAYRKWATGVAGGEKELQEIATSFPDPVKNSPEQYRANLQSIEETTKQILMLNSDFLQAGIDLDQPLDAIFREMKSKGVSVGVPPGTEGVTIIRYDEKGNRL